MGRGHGRAPDTDFLRDLLTVAAAEPRIRPASSDELRPAREAVSVTARGCMLTLKQAPVCGCGAADMEFDSLFWWNFWLLMNVLIAVGLVVTVALFIRWGRRRIANPDARESSLDHP